MEKDEIIKDEEVKEEVKTEPEASPDASPEPSSVLTEESVRKICEEVIGAFLDRFTPSDDEEEEEEEKVEDEESFDY